MHVPVLKYIKLWLALCTFPSVSFILSKSLPCPIANQGHSTVPSLHKHSPFPFGREGNACPRHKASHLQPSDLCPQENRADREGWSIAAAPASCCYCALSCTWAHQGCYPCPQQWAGCPWGAFLGYRRGPDTEGTGTAPAVHLQGRELGQPNPQWNKAGTAGQQGKFWPDIHQAWENTGCLLSSSWECTRLQPYPKSWKYSLNFMEMSLQELRGPEETWRHTSHLNTRHFFTSKSEPNPCVTCPCKIAPLP